jgi:hypothetical protein
MAYSLEACGYVLAVVFPAGCDVVLVDEFDWHVFEQFFAYMGCH